MKFSQIKKNPDNPRIIRDEKFQKLVNSIKKFPKMMSLRPIIVNDEGVILGGNMRYEAVKASGLKEIPNEWVKKASDLTPEEQKEFIIKDNVGFGQWDFDMLANGWDAEKLDEWGLEVLGNLDHIEIPDNPMNEPELGYDKLIQIKCTNGQFEKISEKIIEISEDVGAEVNIS